MKKDGQTPFQGHSLHSGTRGKVTYSESGYQLLSELHPQARPTGLLPLDQITFQDTHWLSMESANSFYLSLQVLEES